MIKKPLTVVGLVLVGMLISVQTVFAADYRQLCLAVGSTSTKVASGPLASTGTGLPIGLWVLVGLVAIAAGLALVLLAANRQDRLAATVNA